MLGEVGHTGELIYLTHKGRQPKPLIGGMYRDLNLDAVHDQASLESVINPGRYTSPVWFFTPRKKYGMLKKAWIK